MQHESETVAAGTKRDLHLLLSFTAHILVYSTFVVRTVTMLEDLT
jgi:hypothetical protein